MVAQVVAVVLLAMDLVLRVVLHLHLVKVTQVAQVVQAQHNHSEAVAAVVLAQQEYRLHLVAQVAQV
jgi:hypothetical protein